MINYYRAIVEDIVKSKHSELRRLEELLEEAQTAIVKSKRVADEIETRMQYIRNDIVDQNFSLIKTLSDNQLDDMDILTQYRKTFQGDET